MRDECREFFAIYGRDGSDLRAPSRFPCYYSKERNDTVITKFSRKQAIFELTLTAAVPGALFVFSCSCLVLCTKVVGIGPDAHMKLMGCRRKRAAEDGSNNAQTIQATELLPGNETETATKVAATHARDEFAPGAENAPAGHAERGVVPPRQ